MPLVFNKDTGKWEDDTAISSLFPAKPEHESTTSQIIEGPRSYEAQRDAELAKGQQLVAIDEQGDSLKGQADERQTAADAEQKAIATEETDRLAREKARQDERAKLISDRDAKIQEEVAAQRKAGGAEADYWKGNETGQLLTHILQGVAAGAAAFRGETGPTAADRAVSGIIGAHKAKLVGEWEATKAARELKDKNIDAWTAEKDRIEAEADRQSQVALRKRQADLEVGLAKYGGADAQAKIDTLKATVNAAAAKDAEATGARYDKESKITNRTPAGTSGQPTQANKMAMAEKWVNNPETGKKEASPDVSQPEIDKTHESYAALQGMNGLRDRLLQFRKDHAGLLPKDWDPDTKSAYGALASEGAGYLTKLNETGVLNAGEFPRYQKIFAPGGLDELMTSEEGIKNGINEIVSGAKGRYSARYNMLMAPSADRSGDTGKSPAPTSKPSTTPPPAAEVLRAKLWLRANPKDPHANSVRTFLSSIGEAL